MSRHLTPSALSPKSFPTPESIVVYGPEGCGKTRHALAIATAFGLRNILDNWTEADPLPKHNTLVLTNIDLSSKPKSKFNAISFNEALKRTRPRETIK